MRFNVGQEVIVQHRSSTYFVYDNQPDCDGDIKVSKTQEDINRKAWVYVAESDCSGLTSPSAPVASAPPYPPVKVTTQPNRIDWATASVAGPSGCPKGEAGPRYDVGLLESLQTIYTETNPNQEGNANMAKVSRTLVSVALVDEDNGLDVSKSLVKDFGTFVMEGSQQELIQEILMDTKYNVESALRAHNAVRAKEVDLDILKRTGNEVKLRDIKLKDLSWKVSTK